MKIKKEIALKIKTIKTAKLTILQVECLDFDYSLLLSEESKFYLCI